MDLTKEQEFAREMAQFASSHYWKIIKEEIEEMIKEDINQLLVADEDKIKEYQGKALRAKQILAIVEDPAEEWWELNQEE